METRLKVRPQQGYNLHNKFTTRSQPYGNQALETRLDITLLIMGNKNSDKIIPS